MDNIYVFDLDGTLIDSMERFGKGVLSVLDEEGILYDDSLIKILTPLGYTGIAEYYIGLGVPGPVSRIFQRITENLVQEYSHNIVLKPYVREYLEKLKGEGGRLFVLTASPHVVTDVCLERNGIHHLFERVWSVEDYGITKSDPQIYHQVAERIGCGVGDIRFYDDNFIALKTARLAGCQVFGVLDIQSPEDLEKVKAEAPLIASYRDLL